MSSYFLYTEGCHRSSVLAQTGEWSDVDLAIYIWQCQGWMAIELWAHSSIWLATGPPAPLSYWVWGLRGQTLYGARLSAWLFKDSTAIVSRQTCHPIVLQSVIKTPVYILCLGLLYSVVIKTFKQLISSQLIDRLNKFYFLNSKVIVKMLFDHFKFPIILFSEF